MEKHPPSLISYLVRQVLFIGARTRSHDAPRLGKIVPLEQFVDDQGHKPLGRLLERTVEDLAKFLLHHQRTQPDGHDPDQGDDP